MSQYYALNRIFCHIVGPDNQMEFGTYLGIPCSNANIDYFRRVLLLSTPNPPDVLWINVIIMC